MIRACNRWQFGDHTMPESISMDRNVKIFHFHKKLRGHTKNQLQKPLGFMIFITFSKFMTFQYICIGNSLEVGVFSTDNI